MIDSTDLLCLSISQRGHPRQVYGSEQVALEGRVVGGPVALSNAIRASHADHR